MCYSIHFNITLQTQIRVSIVDKSQIRIPEDFQLVLSFGITGNLKPIISAVCCTVFSCLWCLSDSSWHTRWALTYCMYVSATQAISSGPRQYWAGVTRLDRYSDSRNRTNGRSSRRLLPHDECRCRSSRANDRSSAKDGLLNIII